MSLGQNALVHRFLFSCWFSRTMRSSMLVSAKSFVPTVLWCGTTPNSSIALTWWIRLVVVQAKDEMAVHVREHLKKTMGEFGYEIIDALVTEIDPDQKVSASCVGLDNDMRHVGCVLLCMAPFTRTPTRSLALPHSALSCRLRML